MNSAKLQAFGMAVVAAALGATIALAIDKHMAKSATTSLAASK